MLANGSFRYENLSQNIASCLLLGFLLAILHLAVLPAATLWRSLGNTQTIFAAYLPDVTEFKKLPVASRRPQK